MKKIKNVGWEVVMNGKQCGSHSYVCSLNGDNTFPKKERCVCVCVCVDNVVIHERIHWIKNNNHTFFKKKVSRHKNVCFKSCQTLPRSMTKPVYLTEAFTLGSTGKKTQKKCVGKVWCSNKDTAHPNICEGRQAHTFHLNYNTQKTKETQHSWLKQTHHALSPTQIETFPTGKGNKEQVPVSEPWWQTHKHKTDTDVSFQSVALMTTCWCNTFWNTAWKKKQ